MAGVRNGVLARGITAAEGSTLIGSVATGFTWLVKTVNVVNATGVAAVATVYALSADGSTTAHLARLQPDPGQGDSWSGWVALNSGDQLFVLSPAGIHVWVSGADLPGELSAKPIPLSGTSEAR